MTRRMTLLMIPLCFALSARPAAGDASTLSLAGILPPDTVLCLIPPEDSALRGDYEKTVLKQIALLPEMGLFSQSAGAARAEFVADVAHKAAVAPEFVESLLDARIGGALLSVTPGRDGKPRPNFVAALALPSPPDRKMVFNAFQAMINRPEVIKPILESQGIDPNIPLKTLVQEENLPGCPPTLRIGGELRIAVIGRMILAYRGPNSEGVQTLFQNQNNPSASLLGSPLFQTAHKGAETGPGMSFVYVNMGRLLSLLDAAQLRTATLLIDSLGLGTVQAAGISGGYHAEGVRHTVYLHAPGPRQGMLATLLPPPPPGQPGMEGASRTLPPFAKGFMAVRVNAGLFFRELPYLLEALGAASPGMAGFAQDDSVLGAPLGEILDSLGNDLVIQPHDDTFILRFDNVDVAAVEQRILPRMEEAAGSQFRRIQLGNYMVNYLNRGRGATLPLAPSFCLIPRQQSNRGVLFMASHPQAIVSFIQESAASTEPLSNAPDYQRVARGLGEGYSGFYYAEAGGSYRRAYNFLLPLASVWAGSPYYPVDVGLLPPAKQVVANMFGCGLGIRASDQGVNFSFYSPLGVNGFLAVVLDKLTVFNPVVAGYAVSLLAEWNLVF